MSISYKKINSMISEQVEEYEDLTQDQRKLLIDLCEKVYMIESSVEQVSGQQIISDIKGEITLKANKY